MADIKCPSCGSLLEADAAVCPTCQIHILSHQTTSSMTAQGHSLEIAGTRCGDFQVLGLLGRGGMGTVYVAYQESMHRRVALKMFDAGLIATEVDLSRFEREAWIGGRLSHPNVVKVYSHGVEKNVHYVAMELVEGHSLAAEIKRLNQERQQQRGSAAANAHSTDRFTLQWSSRCFRAGAQTRNNPP